MNTVGMLTKCIAALWLIVALLLHQTLTVRLLGNTKKLPLQLADQICVLHPQISEFSKQHLVEPDLLLHFLVCV